MTTRPCSAVGGVLIRLAAEGVHLWLDDFHRGQLADGSLRRMVADGLVTGAVSRPAALVRAMTAGTGAYGDRRSSPPEESAEERVYALLAEDARRACALLDPVFRATHGMLGRVSVGVAPSLASDATALTDRARRLAESVGRPNVLIRVPVTPRGLVAAGDLLADGIGVHLTSVYSVNRYAQAVDVYFRGLERAAAGGVAAADVSSLVSLDLGRLGALVDARLDATAAPSVADALRGRAATATAQLVYRRYEESLGCPRWRELVVRGARPQRLLWTTQNAADPTDSETAGHPEIFHLVAWMTLHALPQPALEALALKQHESLRGDTLSGAHGAACAVFDALEQAGVAIESVAHELEQAEHEREMAVWDELVTKVGTSQGT